MSHARFIALANGIVQAVLLAGCISVRPGPSTPVLEAMDVPGLIVKPTFIEGSQSAGREWFKELLENQVSATVQRIAFEGSLAGVIGGPGSSSGDHHRLAGDVSIPIALPPDYRGSRVGFNKGNLATARLALLDTRGEIVAEGEASVRWRDVRWTTGSAKTRKAKNPDLALIDAAELAVERAVRLLIVELRTVGEPDPRVDAQ